MLFNIKKFYRQFVSKWKVWKLGRFKNQNTLQIKKSSMNSEFI